MPTLSEMKSRQTTAYYELVKIETSPTAYYITNAPFDVSYDSNTYKSAGAALSLGAIESNIEFQIPKLSIQIGGIYDIANGDMEPPFIQTVQSLQYVDRPVTIFRSYFDQGTSITNGTFEVFKGYIDSAVINYQPSGTTSVTLETSSQWVRFSDINGRRTNTNSQRDKFSAPHAGNSDTGLDNCKEVIKEVIWK
tara:strand:+ start:10513 stop:11094 length:582 start_codon:yes stop_codon:yes gene_type:complete